MRPSAGDFMHDSPFNLSGKSSTHRDRSRHGTVGVPHGNRAGQQVNAFRLYSPATTCQIGCWRGNQYDFGCVLKLLVGFLKAGGETQQDSGSTAYIFQRLL